MLDDSMAVTLFNQEPPVARHLNEKKLRNAVRIFWNDLKNMVDTGQISSAAAAQKLDVLDQFVAKRLSGQNVLALARDAEDAHPDWIHLMPRLLASRYEELRIARLWSALLNPEALNRLCTAIQAERNGGEEDI